MISKLRKGMVLNYALTNDFKKSDVVNKNAPSGHYFYSPPQRLTDEQIKSLNYACNQNKISYSHVKIQEVIPFAPFISVAAIFTFIAKTTIFLYLMGNTP